MSIDHTFDIVMREILCLYRHLGIPLKS